MTVSGSLRPVEVLHLMARINKEGCSIEDSFKAVMVYLTVMEYVQVRDNRFVLTERGFWALDTKFILRDYEKEILEVVGSNEDIEEIIDIVYCYNFKRYFLNNGILMRSTKKLCKLIPIRIPIVTLTCEGDEKFNSFVKFRSDLQALIRLGKTLLSNGIADAYAFPEIVLGEDFEDYVKSVLYYSDRKSSAKLAQSAATLCEIMIKNSSLITDVTPVNFTATST